VVLRRARTPKNLCVEGEMRRRLYWIAVGGLAFWLPALTLSAMYRTNVSVPALNSVSLAGITLLGVVSWTTRRRMPDWWWVLAGIYILGPAAIFASSSFDRVSPSIYHVGDWIWFVVFCIFPPMTLWLATLNGMIFSVAVATVVLPVVAISRRSR
jgi:hypothetical protein